MCGVQSIISKVSMIKKAVRHILLLMLFFVTSHVFAQVNNPQPDTLITSKAITADSILGIYTSHNSFMKLYTHDTLSQNINKRTDTIFTANGKIKKQKKIDTTHYSPKKAAIWGAAFPGLGQIYMKKYWKLPIVYGILGTVIYFVASNGQRLKEFNGYIRNVYDSVPNPAPYDQLDLSQIETYRNTYRRNVQLASFGTVIAWGLSIVDAVVDAHLHSFDISDKLSMRIKPELNYSNLTYYTGIGVNLNFK